MPAKYTTEQVELALTQLNQNLPVDDQWAIKNEKLCKTFKFTNFISAFGWMSQIAIWAEKLKHHPECFNVYNKVEVDLTTHAVSFLSELDFKMSVKMDLCRTYTLTKFTLSV